MIKYEDLAFEPTKVEGNTKATVKLDNGYQFDIIRNLVKKVYKLKGFEMVNNQKHYVLNYFDGYETYPEFTSRQNLITFINEIEELEELEDD